MYDSDAIISNVVSSKASARRPPPIELHTQVGPTLDLIKIPL
jgi:hypothetical protein